MIPQPRILNLPEDLSTAIASILKNLGTDISDGRRIAECVLKTSDFYIQNPEGTTPWKETWCQIAQVAYFFPLNFLRNQAVMDEAIDVGFPFHKDSVLDFGSGLGAGSLPWLRKFSGRTQFIERAPQAHKLHQELFKSGLASVDFKNWHLDASEIEKLNPRSVIFSYALTELEKIPAWALKADSLVILEPSTRDDGRKLLEKRQELINAGFSIWAPCPHQLQCPLLKNSKTDWCHDRIHLQMPTWFLEIEKHLPIKNKTLTFSYLLASKQVPGPVSGGAEFWRLTGDQLEEKGKTRQMICRNEDREFLTWLHRHGKPTEYFRYEKVPAGGGEAELNGPRTSLLQASESHPHPPRIEKR